MIFALFALLSTASAGTTCDVLVLDNNADGKANLVQTSLEVSGLGATSQSVGGGDGLLIMKDGGSFALTQRGICLTAETLREGVRQTGNAADWIYPAIYNLGIFSDVNADGKLQDAEVKALTGSLRLSDLTLVDGRSTIRILSAQLPVISSVR